MGTSLTVGEKRKLKALEDTIEKGLQSFVDVGNALAEIQRDKLYSDVGETFEEYCKKRWQFTDRHARRLINSAKAAELVSTVPVEIGGKAAGPMGPANERQVRPLTELETEQEQATAWTKAVETAPKDKDGKPKVTAAHVAAVVAEMQGDDEPEADEPDQPEAEPTVAEQMAEWNRSVDAFARKITAVLSEAPAGEYMDENRIGIIGDALKSAASSARQAKGHAECTYCEGAGCKKCRGTGWLTRVDYESSPGAVS